MTKTKNQKSIKDIEHIGSMRLKDFKWEDGKGLDELVIWGLTPMKHLIDMVDGEMEEYMGSEAGGAILILNELRCKVEDVSKTIYRFMSEKNAEEKKEALEPTLTEQFVLWKLKDMTPGVQRLVGDFIDWAIENGGNGKKANLVDLHAALKLFSYDAPEMLRDNIGKEMDSLEKMIQVCLNGIREHKEKIIPTESSEQAKEKAPETTPASTDSGA